MTVSTTINRNDYTAAGGQTIFAYQFKILANTDLQVYVNNVLRTLTTHYTVSGVGDLTGGNVTFVTGLNANDKVLIIRSVPLTQPTDYTASGPFPAETHEEALDRGTMQIQDIDEKYDRALKFTVTSTLTGIDLPSGASATDRAGKVIAWNSAGDDLELLNPTTVDSISLIASKGDLIQGGDTGDAEILPVGNNNDMLQVVSGKAAWTDQITISDFTNSTHNHSNAANGGSTLTSPTIVTPTIASFVNANHNHSDAASGGSIASASAPPYIRLHDAKTPNTAGGNFTSGAWQKRVVTEDIDTNNHCTITDSQITLDAGTYDCFIRCPAFAVAEHQSRLRNITDTATTLVGSNVYSSTSPGNSIDSIIQGKFTIAVSKTFEIQHRCTTTRNTDGFGRKNNYGENEIYTVAEFRKVG